jgi:hypothetical protein
MSSFSESRFGEFNLFLWVTHVSASLLHLVDWLTRLVCLCQTLLKTIKNLNMHCLCVKKRNKGIGPTLKKKTFQMSQHWLQID